MRFCLLHPAQATGADCGTLNRKSNAPSGAGKEGFEAMGIDIQIDSIHEPYVTNGIDAFFAGMERDGVLPREMPERMFRWQEGSGGYFRAGYNAGNVLDFMRGYRGSGDWRDVIEPHLSGDWYLSIEGVKALIAWTAARPITRGMVESFADAVIDNNRKNPEPKVTLTKDQTEVDRLYEWLSRKHDVLLAVLRKAVELNEPPHFSG
jgi:hypothetical protein